ncbi:MAG: Gfo/Idh/MocA family protein [Salinibacter sp.]
MAKLAVVGVGGWGHNVLRNFVDLLGSDRVVACDSDEARIDFIRTHYPDIQIEPGYSRLLKNRSIEAVALATPAITHFDLAFQALSAGKHTFVEKPIAMRPPEAQQLIDLAEERQRVLMVDHLLMYQPSVQKLRALIADGALGRVLHLHGRRLNFGTIRTEENVFWSLGPHDISVVLYLLDEDPVQARASGASFLQDGIEDIATLDLGFASGTQVHLQWSWLDPVKTRRLVVVGETTMAVLDETADVPLQLVHKHVERSADRRLVMHDDGAAPVPTDPTPPLEAACRDFLKSMDIGSPPISDGRVGLRVLNVLDAAHRSIAEGGLPIRLHAKARAS